MASDETPRDEPARECIHKTKVIQFLGRTTPIILQNENGPCPLLSICNVLLLKNNLNLSPEMPEVSQEKLLALVAERLIDSNSNFENKDPDYVTNQQQNIDDAIDSLPRLTTGIDVNLKFTGIRDFEFTRECTIFDLLDIPLYHGWIVDPQRTSGVEVLQVSSSGKIELMDHETANAIGSKSYNRIMGELVSLEARAMHGYNNKPDNDCVDFAAATTAVLGVPSPSLSRGLSFNESPRCVVEDGNKMGKGDLEEAEAFLTALKLSEEPSSSLKDDSASCNPNELISFDKYTGGGTVLACSFDTLDQEGHVLLGAENNGSGTLPPEKVKTEDFENPNYTETTSESIGLMDTNVEGQGSLMHDIDKCSLVKQVPCIERSDKTEVGVLVQNENENKHPRENMAGSETITLLVQEDIETSTCHQRDPTLTDAIDMSVSEGSNHRPDTSISTSNIDAATENQTEMVAEGSNLLTPNKESVSPCSESQNIVEDIVAIINDKEPMYEGEECVIDSGKAVLEDREPMYEGEVALAEQADHGAEDVSTITTAGSIDELTPRQGELIQNFLNSSASQLTISGLFSLQEGLKERELCVFFRNNHFNTMFKYDGQLYLLATDQGYLNQPDLVWEKLNEVNGDGVFMTGSFKEFSLDNNHSETWNEQNAMTSTADYLSSIDNSAEAGSNFNSDHELAVRLQQQEFEQQPQRQNNQQPHQQPSAGAGYRMVTGPQVRRSPAPPSSSAGQQEAKSKDKCNVM